MDDRERVAQLLGREPQGAFDVVVRDSSGDPVVVRNAPFLADGTPMPTRFYLVGADLVRAVSQLEAAGGVRDAEAEVDAAEIAAVHDRYAAERDAAIDEHHVGPRPSGGVGGTRVGVKCLHAHVAHQLAGGDDPLGRWALARLDPALVADTVVDAGSGARQHTAAETMHPVETMPPGETMPPPNAMQPGEVTVRIGDHVVGIEIHGGGTIDIPVGPLALLDGPLGTSDPPTPVDLTNALGLVQDHLDDVLIASPSLAASPRIVVTGDHALAMARVEIGKDTIPDGYTLERTAAEEVFRTLAVETRGDRGFNPGLDAGHVESIIGTCCVILGLMRRLGLQEIPISASPGAGG